jgi:hypothetical protein
MRNTPELIAEIKRRLRYEPSTGRCYWIAVNKKHPRLTGKEAGSLKDKRIYIKVNSLAIPRARIAFVLMLGTFPEIADHINGDTLDDRWKNLREVNALQNSWNITYKRPGKIDNLPIGVRKLGSGFQARVAVNKKTIHLGVFNTAKEAYEAYLEAKKKYHGEFARMYEGS